MGLKLRGERVQSSQLPRTESTKTETHVWVSEPCPQCEGTGEDRNDPAKSCPAGCDQGLQKAKAVPISELVKSVVQQQASEISHRLSGIGERVASRAKQTGPPSD